VQEIAVLFQPLCEEKRLALHVDGLDSGHALPVIGDAGKLRQVLINLVGNAVKFTETGAVRLRLLEQGDSLWRFEVNDTGAGIPPAIGDLVFEPFQQGANGSEKGGTGLGLAIARRQVELMGGILALQSGGDGGSLFHFTLKLPSAATSSAPDSRPMEVCRLASGQQVRALVVDDVAENRQVLSALLGMMGCETAVAENGAQAIPIAREWRPDIVFMDLRLSGVDGLETTRQMASELSPQRIRVVAMSASVLDGERERSLAAGCDEFVAKPFRVDQIYACVAGLLGITFERQSVAGAPAADPGSVSVPEPLAAVLRRAAELHSATGVRGCLPDLEGLGPGGHRLAEHLRGLLSGYDMEAIQQTVGQLSVASAGS
jgi:CheY-like chemotaxis protein